MAEAICQMTSVEMPHRWYYFRIAAVNGRGTGNVAPSGEVSLQAP